MSEREYRENRGSERSDRRRRTNRNSNNPRNHGLSYVGNNLSIEELDEDDEIVFATVGLSSESSEYADVERSNPIARGGSSSNTLDEDDEILFATAKFSSDESAVSEEVATVPNAGWSELGEKDSDNTYNGIDTSNWKTPDGKDLPKEEKQQIASVYQGSTIPGFVIASYGALGSRALWRAFGQIVARRFGERAVFAATINAGDPISPVAELLTLGLAALTIYQIYRAWDDIWTAVDELLSQQVLESYIPPPKELPAFPDSKKADGKTPIRGGGGYRKRWKEQRGKKRIIEWDSQHGKVEVYNKRGKHLGEFDPKTGEQTKPADKSRRVEP